MDRHKDYFEDTDGVVETKRKKRKKTWLIVLFILLAIIVIFLGYLGFLKFKFNEMIPGRKAGTVEEISNLSSPGELRGESSGDVNILFVGMRSKDMVGAYLSSAMMVVNLDIRQNKMHLISIPRDLWLPIDSSYGKANTVYKAVVNQPGKYPENGLPFVKKTFSDSLGIDINYIMVCDFDSFQKIIDNIGKVSVAMSEKEAAGYPFLKLELFKDSKDKSDPTLYHLTGEQSLVFVRWPEDAVPDFDRLRRMQLYLTSFTKQYVRVSTALRPAKNNEILNIAGDNIKIDMQLWEINKIVSILGKVPADNIAQHKLTTDVNTDGGLLRQSNYSGTTYNPIAGDSDFTDIYKWTKEIISK